MIDGNKFLGFFTRPNKIFTILLGIISIGLLAFSIVAIVLELWTIELRISLVIVTTLILLYASYSIAMLLDLPTKLNEKTKKLPLLHRLINDYTARTVIYALGSVIIDITYAVFETIIGYMYNSNWYKVNGFYYMFLGGIRVITILYVKHPFKKTPDTYEQNRTREISAHAAAGIALLGLNVTLYTFFDVMLNNSNNFKRHPIIIYGTAIYTFYKTVFAIGNFIKSRLTDDLTTKTLRNVNIITALVSLLTFQLSLLATYPDALSTTIANGASGTIISLITISLAVSMLVRSYIENKKLTSTNTDENDTKTETH